MNLLITAEYRITSFQTTETMRHILVLVVFMCKPASLKVGNIWGKLLKEIDEDNCFDIKLFSKITIVNFQSFK